MRDRGSHAKFFERAKTEIKNDIYPQSYNYIA